MYIHIVFSIYVYPNTLCMCSYEGTALCKLNHSAYFEYFFIPARIKDAKQRRVLDEAARRRRQRKALEALEQDNFQEDPHADLKMSKKAPKFEESMESSRSIFTDSCIL